MTHWELMISSTYVVTRTTTYVKRKDASWNSLSGTVALILKTVWHYPLWREEFELADIAALFCLISVELKISTEEKLVVRD